MSGVLHDILIDKKLFERMGNYTPKKKNAGINSSGEGYYDYINEYSIFAKGGVSSKKSSWLNKYK